MVYKLKTSNRLVRSGRWESKKMLIQVAVMDEDVEYKIHRNTRQQTALYESAPLHIGKTDKCESARELREIAALVSRANSEYWCPAKLRRAIRHGEEY